MIEYRTKIGKVIVGCWLNGDKGNVILSPGIPQYIGKYHPFLQSLVEMEVNLFVPRYEGSWESAGTFTFEGCVRTIRKTIAMVRKGGCKELFGNNNLSWNTKNTCVVGFSFGALPVLASKIRVAIKEILICPFLGAKYHLGNYDGEDIRQSLDFVARGYGEAYRFNPKKLISELKAVTYPVTVNRRLVLVKGAHDVAIPKEALENFIQKVHPKVYLSQTKHSLVIEKSILAKCIFGDRK